MVVLWGSHSIVMVVVGVSWGGGMLVVVGVSCCCNVGGGGGLIVGGGGGLLHDVHEDLILHAQVEVLGFEPSLLFVLVAHRLSWVEIKGTTYKLGSVVVLSMNLVPTFGIIRDIFVFSTDMYYLLCEVFFTECFSHHFHAYQVCKQMPIDFLLCKQSELHDHTVLECYTVSSQPNSFYVPLKYQIIEY